MRILGFSSVLIVFAILAGKSAASNSNDPLGEKAHYEVDRDSARTSSVIKSGIMDLEVLRYLPDRRPEPAYETELRYDFVVSFLGHETGKKKLKIIERYFTKEFWQDLRTNGRYDGGDFKIKHLGYADAKVMDGHIYLHCDKLLFYDIDTSRGTEVIEILTSLLLKAARASGLEVDAYSEVEDLEIRGLFKEGVPVLRAVKLDVSGTVDGMPLKVGGDYFFQALVLR